MTALNPHTLQRRDLRRLVRELWTDPRCDPVANAALDAAVAVNAQSLDRAVITAYLRHFPHDHASFEPLRAAAAFSAERRDWPWRERGLRWQLWDKDAAPARLAAALLSPEGGASALRDAGLEGDLVQGKLVEQVVVTACLEAAKAAEGGAEAVGTALIAVFDDLQIAGYGGLFAYALLAPWADANPTKEYQRKIGRILTDRIGDPRVHQAPWAALAAECRDRHRINLEPLAAQLRRWLTEATFRAFFKIVRATTDREDQWNERETFWLGYLDTGVVQDAWFAFGRQAEARAATLAHDEDVLYSRIEGGGADPTHSAMIMSIGDLRIAEWSHNGGCRFWDNLDPRAPVLYRKQYFGLALRAMNGGRGYESRFANISHMSNWQYRFAGHIFSLAGVPHPKFGEGLRIREWY